MDGGIDVGAVEDLEPGSGRALDTALTGTPQVIALFRDDDGQYYSTDDTCTHENQSLADGWVESCEVECPLHAARFSLTTGTALCLPATKPVAVHRVEVIDGRVILHPSTSP